MCKKNKHQLKQELEKIKNKPKKKKKITLAVAYSVFFLCLMILYITPIFSLEFDNKASFNLARNEITVKNAYGLGETISKYRLYQSQDSIINAYALGEVTIYNDGLLFDKLQFYDRANKEQPLSYVIYYYTNEIAEIKEPVYKEICSVSKEENKSLICYNAIDSYNTNFVIVEKAHVYNYETVKAGTYKWRIEAKKQKPNQQIDWNFITNGGIDVKKYWAWWSNSWSRKKKIDITELSNTNLYNYTININIPFDSDGKTDFSDLRFVANESDSLTELSYWIESFNASGNANVYVKVSLLTANTNTSIYMYYGNAGVSNIGNISRVGIFGDDFTGTLTDRFYNPLTHRWLAGGTTFNSTETAGTTQHLPLNSTILNVSKCFYEVKMGYTNDASGTIWAGFGMHDIYVGADTKFILTGFGYGNSGLFMGTNFGNNLGSTGSVSAYTINVSYRFRAWTNGSLYNVTALEPKLSLQGEDRNYTSGAFALVTYHKSFYDYVLIRNWSSIEPRLTIGIEEIMAENPDVQLNNPIPYYNSSLKTIRFNCSSNISVGVVNLTLIINGINNYTVVNSTGNENLSLETNLSFEDATYSWNCEARTNSNSYAQNTTRFFSIDTTSPLVKLNNPTNTTYSDTFYNAPYKISINWTINETNLDKCILWNGTTNASVTCSNNGSNINIGYGSYYFYLGVNDTLGRYNSSYIASTFDYKLKNNSITYNNNTVEGTTETFTYNFSIGASQTYQTTYLIYNKTRYYVAPTTDAGGNYIISKSISIPSISVDTNLSFYFEVNLASGTLNSSVYNQTVKNVGLDNCSTNTVRLYNFTLVDEELQTELNGTDTAYNTTIEVDFYLKNLEGTIILANLSEKFYQTNPVSICLNINLTSSKLRVDSTVRYSALNYADEFYNMQNTTINNDTIGTNINLYDLLNTSSTKFVLTYKDSSYNPVENALVIIQRKYISEGVFKTVEIPLTDIDGKTTVHLDTDSVIYSIIIMKEGKVLSTFSNVVVSCDNELIGDCKINLNPSLSSNAFDNPFTKDNLYYTMEFNETTRTITVNYLTTDGSVVDMILNASKFDKLMNTTVCSDTDTGQAGVLTCLVPESYGNVTVVAYLYKDNEFITDEIFHLKENLNNYFGADRIFFMIMFIILIPLMFISSLTGMLIGLLISLILSSLLYLFYSKSIIGQGSALLWIAIAIGIALYKISKRSKE